MKRRNLTIGCIAFALLAMISCTKKEQLVPTSAASGGLVTATTPGKTPTDKDGGDGDVNELDSIAQAANIKSISYNKAQISYIVRTYLNSTTYQVQVVSFKIDSGADMKVTTSTHSKFELKFNEKDSFIYISNLGTYSFDNFSDSTISIKHSFEKNLIAVMTSFVGILPQSSRKFTNNGDKDTFPSSEKRRRRFFGVTHVFGPCGPFGRSETTYVTIFWIRFNDGTTFGNPC